ncbi:MAG: hypothetical protein IPG39_15055 [Bacteroidetes bacterium]|nr:hypothetical protein [Bacteroidota bacterium]
MLRNGYIIQPLKKFIYLKEIFKKIDINKTAFKEGLGKETDAKENVLFLSLLATLGKETSSTVVEWFKKINFINGIHDQGQKRYTIDKLKNDKTFLNWVLHFIKYLEISNLSTTEADVNEVDLESLRKKEKNEEVINLLASIQKYNLNSREEIS